MIKWAAFILALMALTTAADERKTRAAFDRMQARVAALEGRQCTLMLVLTPSGESTICAPSVGPQP